MPTGSRCPCTWSAPTRTSRPGPWPHPALPGDHEVSKRLLLTNGDHNAEKRRLRLGAEVRQDRKAWMDHWIRGVNGGVGTGPSARSRYDGASRCTRTATASSSQRPEGCARTGRSDDTKWTDWYLHGDGSCRPASPVPPSRPRVRARHPPPGVVVPGRRRRRPADHDRRGA